MLEEQRTSYIMLPEAFVCLCVCALVCVHVSTCVRVFVLMCHHPFPRLQNLIKATDAAEKQQNLLRLQEQEKKNLVQEVHNYRQEAQKQRKIIYQLETDRDRYINETSSLMQKVGGVLAIWVFRGRVSLFIILPKTPQQPWLRRLSGGDWKAPGSIPGSA